MVDVQQVDDAVWAATYVRYHLEGAKADHWATADLSQLAIDSPRRTWELIQKINTIPVEDAAWRATIRASIGCGALEELIVLHESEFLPIVLDAAMRDAVVREELSAIYESSVRPELWVKLQTVVAQQPLAADAPKGARR